MSQADEMRAGSHTHLALTRTALLILCKINPFPAFPTCGNQPANPSCAFCPWPDHWPCFSLRRGHRSWWISTRSYKTQIFQPETANAVFSIFAHTPDKDQKLNPQKVNILSIGVTPGVVDSELEISDVYFVTPDIP